MSKTKTLEEVAIEAILAEARRLKEVADEHGSTAWQSRPGGCVNRRFAANLVSGSLQSNSKLKRQVRENDNGVKLKGLKKRDPGPSPYYSVVSRHSEKRIRSIRKCESVDSKTDKSPNRTQKSGDSDSKSNKKYAG